MYVYIYIYYMYYIYIYIRIIHMLYMEINKPRLSLGLYRRGSSGGPQCTLRTYMMRRAIRVIILQHKLLHLCLYDLLVLVLSLCCFQGMRVKQFHAGTISVFGQDKHTRARKWLMC